MTDPDPKAAIEARFNEITDDTKVPNLVTKAEWKTLKSGAEDMQGMPGEMGIS